MSNGTETYTDSNGELWNIIKSGSMMGEAFEFSHYDYDGPEDPRCGTAGSVEDCKKEIEEMIS